LCHYRAFIIYLLNYVRKNAGVERIKHAIWGKLSLGLTGSPNYTASSRFWGLRKSPLVLTVNLGMEKLSELETEQMLL
jgi:hypothetical protein